MARTRRRLPPVRIFLHRPDGRALRRELPPHALDGLLRRLCEQGGAHAATTWERTGQFPSASVLAAWPEGVLRPEAALVVRGEPGTSGAWLEASFAPGAALQEIAEDLAQALLGAEAPTPVQAEPELTRRPATAVVAAPASPEREEGPFALSDFVPGAGLLDAGAEVRRADLPGLLPGDRLQSPRRGACVIVKLDPAQGRVLLRDERGRTLEVDHAEITAEFSFDDVEDEVGLS